MSGGISWRSPSAADQYRHHDYADFAQEFLHRNADYQRDHAETLISIAKFPNTEVDEKEGLSRRWGLSFPHRSRSGPTREACALVAAGCPRCGCGRDPRHRGDPAAVRL